jgi:hypothetical protein
MPIEWLGLSKLVPVGTTAAKSIYDRIIGKAPRLNFDADSGGIELQVLNTRQETIIIESIEATPPLLGFSTGEKLAPLASPMTSATTLESINEICFANFFMAHACPLQFGIRAAGARSSSRDDLELPPSTRRRTGNIGHYSQPYCP